MVEDPDRVVLGGKKRKRSSSCFNLILTKESSKRRSLREAYASRFQLQACSEEEKQSWLEAFEQCGVSVLKPEKEVYTCMYIMCNSFVLSIYTPITSEARETG